jgi:hypothetical protein
MLFDIRVIFDLAADKNTVFRLFAAIGMHTFGDGAMSILICESLLNEVEKHFNDTIRKHQFDLVQKIIPHSKDWRVTPQFSFCYSIHFEKSEPTKRQNSSAV